MTCTDHKRAGQGSDPYPAFKVFMGVFGNDSQPFTAERNHTEKHCVERKAPSENSRALIRGV